MLVVERAADVLVDLVAELVLDRKWNERNNAARQSRQAENRGDDKRSRGGKTQSYDVAAQPPFRGTAAIERLGAVFDRRGEFRRADFEPRQQCFAAPAEAEHALGRRHAAQFDISPFVEQRLLIAVAGGEDPQGGGASLDDDVVARARRAVEIDGRSARRRMHCGRVSHFSADRQGCIRFPRRRAHRPVLRRAPNWARRSRAHRRAPPRPSARPIARRAATSRR